MKNKHIKLDANCKTASYPAVVLMSPGAAGCMTQWANPQDKGWGKCCMCKQATHTEYTQFHNWV